MKPARNECLTVHEFVFLSKIKIKFLLFCSTNRQVPETTVQCEIYYPNYYHTLDSRKVHRWNGILNAQYVDSAQYTIYVQCAYNEISEMQKDEEKETENEMI